MRKLIILTVLLCSKIIIAEAQISPTLKIDNLTNFGNQAWETLSDITFDQDGNYYICGSFTGELVLKGQTVMSAGKRDIFIAKMNKQHTVLWLKSYGGVSDDNAYSIIFADDYLYLAGSFKKEIELKTGELLQAEAFTDVFLAKLNTEGEVQWGKALKSKSAAQKTILQKCFDGNICIAGSYKKTLTAETTSVTAFGKTDIYYACYDTQGALKYIKSFGGTGDDELYDLKISQANDLFFAGSFEDNIDLTSHSVNAVNKTDGFVIKMNALGETEWATQIGGAYKDVVKSISLDDEANVYAAGEFDHQISIIGNDYIAQRTHDVFFAKMDAAGTLNWADQLGGDSYNNVSKIESVNTERFYLSGNFRGKLGGLKSERNSKDAFIARYMSTNEQEWIINSGHINEDQIKLKSGPEGALFVSGYFSNAFSFLDEDITNKNYKDLYFGKLIDCDIMPKVDLGEDQTSCTAVELTVEDKYTDYIWSTGQNSVNNITVNESGVYYLDVKDVNGCSSSDTIEVIIQNNLTVDLGPDTTICEGENLVLNAGTGFTTYLWDDNSTQSQRTVTESGTYSVSVSNETGCGSDEIGVTVKPVPVFELGETIYLQGEDLFLDPGLSGENYTYLWNNDATTSTLSVPVSAFRRVTNVSLIVTDESGCSYTDDVIVNPGNPPAPAFYANTDEAENMEKENESKDVEQVEEIQEHISNIYPNPTTGKLYITVSEPGKVKRIDVFNAKGQHIKYFENPKKYPFELDLTSKAKGLYLIKISKENSVKEFKVILK
ncbi:MAG: T9SS type A sorting domain-containing protein [bacterium]|nr:T9SS type A sorting domain-containing protein [bacterium]